MTQYETPCIETHERGQHRHACIASYCMFPCQYNNYKSVLTFFGVHKSLCTHLKKIVQTHATHTAKCIFYLVCLYSYEIMESWRQAYIFWNTPDPLNSHCSQEQWKLRLCMVEMDLCHTEHVQTEDEHTHQLPMSDAAPPAETETITESSCVVVKLHWQSRICTYVEPYTLHLM